MGAHLCLRPKWAVSSVNHEAAPAPRFASLPSAVIGAKASRRSLAPSAADDSAVALTARRFPVAQHGSEVSRNLQNIHVC